VNKLGLKVNASSVEHALLFILVYCLWKQRSSIRESLTNEAQIKTFKSKIDNVLLRSTNQNI